MMSTYIQDADISAFNAAETLDWYPVPAEFCNAIEYTLQLSAATDGAFDITAGPLVDLWGFGPAEMKFEPPTAEEIASALAKVGYEHLQVDCSLPAIRRDVEGLAIDLSAYGKGYAVDQVAEALADSGFENFLVEIGGEIRVAGSNSRGENWAIGIEVPRAGVREPYTVVRLTELAVATSGDYRNFFEYEGVRYSHEIDTHTGKPVTHELAAVSIIDESAATADALATGLLVMGPDAGFELAEQQNIAALFLTRTDNGVEERVSPRFEELVKRL
jgi:thiamine biosynthesis lipoprotein